MNNDQRIEWIDRMRALAILSVVMEHLTIGRITNDFVYIRWIGCANMPVFFFISAYLMELRSNLDTTSQKLNFLQKKTFQLMIPFLVWPLIIRKYVFQTDWRIISFTDIKNEFINPHLWFFLTLYGFCLIFLVYKFIDNKGLKFGSTLFLLCMSVIINLLFLKYHLFKNAALYCWYFVGGVIVQKYNLIDYLGRKILSSISLILIFASLMFWHVGNTSVLNVLIKMEVSCATIILIYYLCTQCKWNKQLDKIIQPLGLYSLAIYVIHWPFLSYLKSPIIAINNELIVFGFVLVLGLIISYVSILIYQFINKLPGLNFILFGKS